MAVVNFTYPKFKYTIAATGQPGVGYKLFTYEEGTSTKKTTWTSLAKTGENTNPIILDANGEADVWIDGNYKFVLAPPTDTDPPTSPVWTYDAIRSTDGGSTVTSGTATPTNGSFETDTDADTVPDNWTAAALSGGTVAIDSTTSTHGTNSLKFTSSGSGGGSISTDEYYEVEAGKDVGIRFSIISANADTHNTVEAYWYNSSKVFISAAAVYDDAATNPTSWTRYYLSGSAPATAKFVRLVITGVAADSTTHSSTNFDNIELDTTYTGELFNSSAPTPTELSYVSGVTSAIQTQIDNTAGRRGALVTHSVTQALTTPTTVAFDTEDYDTSAIHDTVTNNSRLTVPSGVTKVKLTGLLTATSTAADGYAQVILYKNGAILPPAGYTIDRQVFFSTTAGSVFSIKSPILSVSPGDYFELVASEGTTGNVTISNVAGPNFSMEIIE